MCKNASHYEFKNEYFSYFKAQVHNQIIIKYIRCNDNRSDYRATLSTKRTQRIVNYWNLFSTALFYLPLELIENYKKEENK